MMEDISNNFPQCNVRGVLLADERGSLNLQLPPTTMQFYNVLYNEIGGYVFIPFSFLYL